MRYAKIKFNDIANGDGIGVSLFVQGCHAHCFKCFNPETWDFNGGEQFTEETMQTILDGISINGIERHFSILGGEPLCPENLPLTNYVITKVKEQYPNITIYLWTGFLYDDLIKLENSSLEMQNILDKIDFLVDGPFIYDQRDISLKMRGSRNQHIYKNPHTSSILSYQRID